MPCHCESPASPVITGSAATRQSGKVAPCRIRFGMLTRNDGHPLNRHDTPRSLPPRPLATLTRQPAPRDARRSHSKPLLIAHS
jgi:hypothetical protein